MTSLLIKEVRMRSGGLIGWTLGLGLWGFLVAALYPSIGAQFADLELPAFYEAFGPVTAIGELPGFLTFEVFNFAVPIALGIYALVLGTGVLAGEEDDGTLELLMALPIPRWKLVLAKALFLVLTLGIVLAALCLSVWVGIQAIRHEVDVSVGAADLALVGLQSWLLVAALGMISLFLGAYLPHRRHASTIGAVILAVSYLLDSLAQMTDTLDPYQPLSLSHYYDPHQLLTSGLVWEDTIVLAGVAVIFLALALLSFQRRDVTVGAWPWQRATVTPED